MKNYYCKLINLDEVTYLKFDVENQNEFNKLIFDIELIFRFCKDARVILSNDEILKTLTEIFCIDNYETLEKIPNDKNFETLNLVFDDEEYSHSTMIKINKKDYLNLLDKLIESNVIKTYHHKTKKTDTISIGLLVIALIFVIIEILLPVDLIFSIVPMILCIFAGIINFLKNKFDKNEKKLKKYYNARHDLVKKKYNE